MHAMETEKEPHAPTQNKRRSNARVHIRLGHVYMTQNQHAEAVEALLLAARFVGIHGGGGEVAPPLTKFATLRLHHGLSTSKKALGRDGVPRRLDVSSVAVPCRVDGHVLLASPQPSAPQ